MAKIGNFPLIIRPAFTLGGTGGGIAYNMEEFEEIIATGLDASMTNQASHYRLRKGLSNADFSTNLPVCSGQDIRTRE